MIGIVPDAAAAAPTPITKRSSLNPCTNPDRAFWRHASRVACHGTGQALGDKAVVRVCASDVTRLQCANGRPMFSPSMVLRSETCM
jgi:hypothetical protein